MRIAFVSREFAGHGNGGGIGTYVRNAATMLAQRGHEVMVFTCGDQASSTEAGVSVRATGVAGSDFAQAIVRPFVDAHREAPFDVIESAEYQADAEIVFDAAPEVARVVRLHTASFQLGRMNEAYLSHADKARFIAGALRRGRLPKPYWNRYSPDADGERALALAADEVTAPSQAILDWTRSAWPLAIDRTSVFPNVFVPLPELLAAEPDGREPLVTFVGKLEARKGVLDLARAIPKVLAAVPGARFRFVGRALPHPSTRQPLDEAVLALAGRAAADRIEFTGGVAYSEVSRHLAQSAVAVFPSYWENLPYVVLEAMAAGCAVIGSTAGGMPEMIEDGRTGLLVPPRDPAAIARAVVRLLSDRPAREAMGVAARESVLSRFSPTVVAPIQEASYARALARARARTGR